jgi:hypothetical protein
MLRLLKRSLDPRITCRLAVCLLLPWISWSTSERVDPLSEIKLQNYNLIGRVAVVVVQNAAIVQTPSGPMETAATPTDTFAFDGEGLLLQWSKHGSRSVPRQTILYTYSDGRLVRKEASEPSGRVIETTTYSTSEDGLQVTAAVARGRNAPYQTVVYQYGPDGTLVSVAELDADGVVSAETKYTYKSNENRADRYDAQGELVSWSIEELDGDGRVAEISLHSAESEEEPYTISYEYDDHGNVTLERTSGKVALGPILFTPGPPQTTSSYEYTYDEHDNWVKRVRSVPIPDSDPQAWRRIEVTHRAILYYD